MVRFYAHRVLEIYQVLVKLEMIAQTVQFATAKFGDPEFGELIDREFDELSRYLDELALPMSAKAAERLRAELRPGREMRQVAPQFADLQSRLMDELSTVVAFAVPSNRAQYCRDTTNFGDEVAIAFPSTSYDIAEAGKCVAFACYTASVFHLMRVLELGLKVFARRFQVPAEHTNWHNVIEGIEKSVRNMASDANRSQDWRDEQEFFSQCASHFMLLKEAWRNYTAHGRGKYTEEEATLILINVRAFMERLSLRLNETA